MSDRPDERFPRRRQDRLAVHILLADDDEHPRHLLCSMLLAAGMRVTEAGDGTEALALAVDRAPDVAVVDWPMPAGGLPLAEQLIARLGMIGRVIMLADAYDRRDHHAALKAGARYLVKPHAADRLIATVLRAAGADCRSSAGL